MPVKMVHRQGDDHSHFMSAMQRYARRRGHPLICLATYAVAATFLLSPAAVSVAALVIAPAIRPEGFDYIDALRLGHIDTPRSHPRLQVVYYGCAKELDLRLFGYQQFWVDRGRSSPDRVIWALDRILRTVAVAATASSPR
jgi:hypothetical protein